MFIFSNRTKRELAIKQLHEMGENPSEILEDCDEVELIDDSLSHVLQLLQEEKFDELATIWVYTKQKMRKNSGDVVE